MTVVRTMAHRFGVGVRRVMEAYPSVYAPIYRRFGAAPQLLPTRDTDLLIDGFPRSANTFAAIAIDYAQPRPLKLSGHLHSPGCVLAAVELGVPTCVLVRRPADAVASLIVRNPQTTVAAGLLMYATYYETVARIRESVVVASFDTVTRDLGSVIDAINARFVLNLYRFEHDARSVAAVRERLERRNGSRGVRYAYLPDGERDRLKQTVRVDEEPALLKRCAAVFERFLKIAH